MLYGHVTQLVDELLAALPDGFLDTVGAFATTEARGFVIGSLLAGRTGKPLILIRKAGKLPPPVFSENYTLEYGTDTLQIKANLPKTNVLLVDDVLATGGTLIASKRLCEQAGHGVLGALVLLDLAGIAWRYWHADLFGDDDLMGLSVI
ncbi:Adenine phosphoribosyltransferase [Moraxella caviae]|uniref:Adenine phosphoribosyltransferase n=1 Tax=Moraxella caviae TaxID=34060 RepID=A0A378R8R6_9GAMM|nr:Adenine phosphoribosyltransferase [Moraxella caviae]